MAFRDMSRHAGFTKNLPAHRDKLFYNTDSFVGTPAAGAIRSNAIKANQEDDVLLVQFFFKKIAANPQAFTSPFRPPKKFPVMKVDGIFGQSRRPGSPSFRPISSASVDRHCRTVSWTALSVVSHPDRRGMCSSWPC